MTEKEKEKKCMYVIQTHSLTHSITSFAHSLKRARTHSPKRTHTLMHAYIHIHSVPLLEDGLKSVRSCVWLSIVPSWRLFSLWLYTVSFSRPTYAHAHPFSPCHFARMLSAYFICMFAFLVPCAKHATAHAAAAAATVSICVFLSYAFCRHLPLHWYFCFCCYCCYRRHFYHWCVKCVAFHLLQTVPLMVKW